MMAEMAGEKAQVIQLSADELSAIVSLSPAT